MALDHVSMDLLAKLWVGYLHLDKIRGDEAAAGRKADISYPVVNGLALNKVDVPQVEVALQELVEEKNQLVEKVAADDSLHETSISEYTSHLDNIDAIVGELKREEGVDLEHDLAIRNFVSADPHNIYNAIKAVSDELKKLSKKKIAGTDKAYGDYSKGLKEAKDLADGKEGPTKVGPELEIIARCLYEKEVYDAKSGADDTDIGAIAPTPGKKKMSTGRKLVYGIVGLALVGMTALGGSYFLCSGEQKKDLGPYGELRLKDQQGNFMKDNITGDGWFEPVQCNQFIKEAYDEKKCAAYHKQKGTTPTPQKTVSN